MRSHVKIRAIAVNGARADIARLSRAKISVLITLPTLILTTGGSMGG